MYGTYYITVLLLKSLDFILSFITVSVAAAPQIPPAQTQKAPAPPPPSGPRYVAVYDYTAADDDEISFQEGMSIPIPLFFSYFTSFFPSPPPPPQKKK